MRFGVEKLSNPFRVKTEPSSGPSYFEASGSRTILKKGEFQSPNYVKSRKGWRVNSEGEAEFQKVHIGSQLITLSQGDSLQAAIDDLSLGDGGHIFLQAGTYNILNTVNLKSSIQIEGENKSTTIIDFGSASRQFKATGTSIYTTGTITSIANGVTVTGSGTLWLANVTADHQFFIANRWYKIASITSDTTLVLAEGYAGGATFPGAAYRAVKIIKDIEFKELTIQNSTTNALDLDDCRDITFDGVQFITNNKGVVADNCSELIFNEIIIVSSTSNGLELNTCGFSNANSLSTPSNGGHGVVFNDFRIGSFFACSSDSNTGDGYNLTSCSVLNLNIESSSNGGQGIELVSGNTGINIVDGFIESNTSDGIKLTASSDRTIISRNHIIANGAYGVNIFASTCDSPLVIGCIFDNNTSGAINNSGTNTLIRSNIGAADSP